MEPPSADRQGKRDDRSGCEPAAQAVPPDQENAPHLPQGRDERTAPGPFLLSGKENVFRIGRFSRGERKEYYGGNHSIDPHGE